MSEKVTIKELLELPEKFFIGQSKLSLEGTLKTILEPREVEGTRKDGKPYHFWSQFLVADDGSGEIGVDWTVGTKEEAIPQTAKGKKIKITDAKADTYEKEGKTIRKLTHAKIQLVNGSPPITSAPPQSGYQQLPSGDFVVSREVWEEKDKRITRTALAKSFIESGKKWCAATKSEADFWFGWIYESNNVEKVEEEPVKQNKEEKKKETKSAESKEKKSDSDMDRIVDKEFDRAKIRKNILAYFVEGHKLGIFSKDYDLAKWLGKEFGKQALTALTDDEMLEAERMIRMDVIASRKLEKDGAEKEE